MEVEVHQPLLGNLVIFDVTEVACSIKPLLEGLSDSLSDVPHGGRPCMVQSLFEPGWASLKLVLL